MFVDNKEVNERIKDLLESIFASGVNTASVICQHAIGYGTLIYVEGIEKKITKYSFIIEGGYDIELKVRFDDPRLK